MFLYWLRFILQISEFGDNQTPVSERLVDDEGKEIKNSSGDSDDKLKRKLVDVFEGEQTLGSSSTKTKIINLSDDSEQVTDVGSSKDGFKFLTPKVEK